MAHKLWETLLSTYEKKVTATNIYMIRCLYILLMKESDSITTRLSAYPTLIGMRIEEELHALIFLSILPPS